MFCVLQRSSNSRDNALIIRVSKRVRWIVLAAVASCLTAPAAAQTSVWEDKANGQGPKLCCNGADPPVCSPFFWPDNDNWEQSKVVGCLPPVVTAPSNWTTPFFPNGISYDVIVDAEPPVQVQSVVTIGGLSVGDAGRIDMKGAIITVPLGHISNDGVIEGFGSIAGAASFQNNNLVAATLGLTVGAIGEVDNAGTLRASSGGILVLGTGLYRNNGVIEAEDDARVFLYGPTFLGGEFRSGASNSWIQDYLSATIAESLTNNARFLVAGPPPYGAALYIRGDITVSGTGQVEVSSGYISGDPTTDSATTLDHLTNAAGHVIKGQGKLSGMTITNESLIVGSLTINPETTLDPATPGVVNDGIIRASGGILVLGTGLYRNNGVIEAEDDARVFLYGPTFLGGEFRSGASNSWIQDYLSATIAESLTNNARFLVAGPPPYGAALYIRGDITLSGTGQVEVSSGYISGDPTTDSATTLDHLTNAAGHVIKGQGKLSGMTITNESLIAAEGGGSLTINPETALGPATPGVVNDAILRASSGGTLTLGIGVYRNNGVIEAEDDARVLLYGPTFLGGEFRSGASNSSIQDYGGATFAESLTNNALFLVSGPSPYGAALYIRGDITVSGSGQVEVLFGYLSGDPTTDPATTLDHLTNGAGHVIKGHGTISGMTITNESLIAAEGGGSLTINPETALGPATPGVVNDAILRASSGGTLTLGIGVYRNNGVIEAQDNSYVRLGTGALVVGGEFRSGATNSSIQVPSSNRPAISGSIGNNSLLIAATGPFGVLYIHGDTTLSGNGQLLITQSVQGDPTTDPSTTVDRLTNTGDHVIRGNGTIGPGVEFINNAVVAPGAPVGTLTVQGTYQQEDAGVLLIEITGATQNDRLQVTEQAMLSGGLRVAFPTAFRPSVGDVFTVLTTATVQGTFNTVVGPGDFTVEYHPTSVVIRVGRIPCDHDGDGDCDCTDYKALLGCLSGPRNGLRNPVCEDFDFDGDADIDLLDFRNWSILFTGCGE